MKNLRHTGRCVWSLSFISWINVHYSHFTFLLILPFFCYTIPAGTARQTSKRRGKRKKMAEPNDSDFEFEYVPCPCCETPLEARSWGKKNLRRVEVKTESSWVLLYIAGKWLRFRFNWCLNCRIFVHKFNLIYLIFFRRFGATVLHVPRSWRYARALWVEEGYDDKGPTSDSYVE